MIVFFIAADEFLLTDNKDILLEDNRMPLCIRAKWLMNSLELI